MPGYRVKTGPIQYLILTVFRLVGFARIVFTILGIHGLVAGLWIDTPFRRR